MWAYESVFYQIYPIGFCDAPRVNDGVLKNRIGKVADWAPHIAKLGCNAVYFSPIFESDSHGYDTRDFPQDRLPPRYQQGFCRCLQNPARTRHQGRAGRRVQPCRPRFLGLSRRAGEKVGLSL